MKHLRLSINVFALAFLLSLVANAQDPTLAWAKRMGGTDSDAGYSIAIDASGNVYTIGYFRDTVDFDPGPGEYKLVSTNDASIFITKLDANGNFVWARQMEGRAYGYPSSPISIDDVSGSVYITGNFEGTVDFDPGPGTFELTSTGFQDIFICKLNSDGNFVWAKQMGGSSEGVGNAIAVDASGNVYTTGGFSGTIDFNPGADTFALTSTFLQSDMFVSKLDPDGNFVWAKQMECLFSGFGVSPFSSGLSIAIDSLGNVYTTGTFRGKVDFDPGADTFELTGLGQFEIYVIKLNADGDFVWAKQMGGDSWDIGNSLAIDASGNIYITGFFKNTADFNPDPDTSFMLTSAGGGGGLNSGGDIFISKLDADGDFVWAKRMGGSWPDNSYSIAVDALGNVYTTGYFESTADFDPGSDTFALTATDHDIFISKLDSDGNFLWAKQIGSSESYSIAVDASGNVYITGAFQDTVDFDPGPGEYILTPTGNTDIFVVKLSQSTISTTNPPIWSIFNIYPNPTNDYFTLHLQGEPRQDILVELLSSTGQAVFREALDFQSGAVLKNYSCRNVPAGMYSVRVSDAQGSVFRKIIIE